MSTADYYYTDLDEIKCYDFNITLSNLVSGIRSLKSLRVLGDKNRLHSLCTQHSNTPILTRLLSQSYTLERYPNSVKFFLLQFNACWEVIFHWESKVHLWIVSLQLDRHCNYEIQNKNETCESDLIWIQPIFQTRISLT